MIQLISFDRDKAIAAGMTITAVRRPPSPSPEHPPETIVRIPHTPFVAEDRGTPDRIMIRPSTSLGVFFLKVWLRTNMIPHENLPAAAERQRLATLTEDGIDHAPTQQYQEIVEKYNELLYHVSIKFTNETRHETALRYIKNAEAAEAKPAEAKEEP